MLFSRIDALALTRTNLITLVFCNTAKNFYKDLVYHFKDPSLVRWKVRKRSRDIKYLYTHSCYFELFQFLLDVSFVTAKPVQFLNNKRISLTKYLPLEVLIALTLSILALTLIDDNVLLGNSELGEGFDLPVFILFTGRYSCVSVAPVVHITSNPSINVGVTLWMAIKSKLDFYGHIFACF